MADCRKCADFDWCAEHEDCGLFNPKPITNADRIRAMTDEELAEYLDGVCHALWQLFAEDSQKMWLDWLKQEYKECEEK